MTRETAKKTYLRAATRTPHSLVVARVVLATSGALAGLGIASCYNMPLDALPELADSQGTVGLELTLAPGIEIASVTYTIAGPGGFTKTDVIDVSHSATIGVVIGGLAAGPGYTISFTATSTDGRASCAASTNFSVIANTTTTVPVVLRCVRPSGNGSVIVGGNLNVCPVVDAVSVTPLAAPVGGTITLQAVATDLDQLPSPLAYSWTTSSGTLADASTASPKLTCSETGTPTITISVSDGDPAPGCAATMSFQVTCATCVGEGTSCNDQNACTVGDTCHAGVCAGSNAPSGTSCSDNGGQICNAGGACVPFRVRVARVGLVGGTLSIGAAPVVIESWNVSTSTQGASVVLPTTASGANLPLTVGGLALTDAALSRSADGHYLIIPGYGTIPSATNPVTSVTVPRVVGRIDAAGNVDTSTVLSGAFQVGNMRSGVSVDGSSFWVGGIGATADGGVSTGGIWNIARGTTGGTQISPSLTRTLTIGDGQLFAAGDTGAMLLLAKVGIGLPTTSGQSVTALTGMVGAAMSPWAFAFFDRDPAVPGVDTVYVANDQQVGGGDAGTLAKGVQKWTFTGTTWSLADTLNLPTPVGYRGIAGAVVGSSVTLVASTVETATRLVVFVDDGITAPRVLATAPSGTVYRGVSLPPM